MSKSKFVNKNVNASVVYEVTKDLDNKKKFIFYKSVLLYLKLVKGEIPIDDFDVVKEYIDNHYKAFNGQPAIELLLMQRDLIMLKYLALKSTLESKLEEGG